MRNFILVLVVALMASTTAIKAAVNNQPMWADPSAMAMKRVSDIPTGQHSSNTFGNLDCTEVTYRLVGHSDMRTGCFVPTAFGMLDPDYDIAIFNGTDEGLPLHTNVPHRVLVPWPKALNLVTLDAADTGGSYIKIYRNPLAGMQDERGWEGELVAKRLATPPDINLKDANGKPLVVNPSSLAFTDNGSWLVAETLSGSFVRINLASLDRMSFAPSFAAAGWPGRLFQSRVAVSEDGRYVAIGNDYAGSLRIYDLHGCSGKICPSHDYLPFLRQKIGGLKYIRDLRFVNDGLLSFEASSDSGGGVYELAPTSSISSLTDYIGLGDSYTSGEGAFDYLSGTDTSTNTCHLSVNSYPLLLTRDLFSAASGHSMACSGAVINDVGSTSNDYRGQTMGKFDRSTVMSSFLPGYVAQHRFVAQYQPRVMTVSIGGNDIGFGDILERCVVPHISRHHSDENCYNTYESRQEVVDLVDRTVKRWTSLYQQLQAASPAGTVYAIGYPSIASDVGKCPVNVRLDKNELEFAEELIHYMDASIRRAAVAAGVPYVDIEHALAGHRLCEASGGAAAMNGLTAGNDFGVFGIGLLGRESYHPNALGHELIEQAILRQTDNLSSGSGADTTPPDSTNILNAPKTGRTMNTLVLDHITERQAEQGKSVQIRVSGGRDGLRPSSHFAVHLDGPTGPLIGSLDSDSQGNLSGTVTIPQDTDTDTHTIDAFGPGQNDNQVDVRQSIYLGFLRDVGVYSNVKANLVSSKSKKTTAGKNNIKPEFNARPEISQSFGVLHSFLSSQPFLRSPIATQKTPVARILAVFVICTLLAIFGRQIIKSYLDYFGRRCNNWLKNDYGKICSWFTIVIMRTFGVVVFSIILFASLLVFGFSTSSNSAVTDQKKIEAWLSESNLYGAFVKNAINQADQTAGNDQSGGVSLSDTAVKQAAEQSFSSGVLKKHVNTFLNSNYVWLRGKTDKPQFRIDLSSAKQDFAERVGKYVTTYLKGLSTCSAAQLANINPQTADPLTLQCLPRGLNPATVGSQVTEQIATSTQFLSNTVITADSINPESNNGQMEPYYKRFSALPSLYQVAVKIPWVAAVVSLLSLAAIIMVAYSKRKGLRAIAIVFALAGLIMVLTKLITDQVFNSIEKHIFNAASVGQLQKSLTVFLHHVETQIVKVDLWFGIGYLLIALVLVLTLVFTRKRGLRIPKPLQNLMPSDDGSEEGEADESPEPRPQPESPKAKPKPSPKSRPARPPRLVQ